MAEQVNKADEDFSYFLVHTKGYKKQFSSGMQARRIFSKIENDAKRESESVSIKLFAKKRLEDEWILLDELEIKTSYYEK